ncbi:MAG: hypothetical protein AAB074_01880 [Planctomycetota bacterium]
MRQFFFVFVLVAYIWAAPTGRPDIDRFDSNAIGIARCAAKMQADWKNHQYAALLEVCAENRRAEAIRALVFAIEEGWSDEAVHPPQLSGEQSSKVREFETRILKLEDEFRLAATSEEIRALRATQCVLYSEILAWAHANHRVSPAMLLTFSNEPQIVRFDGNRADVQFCAADRSKAVTDPRVTFQKSGARWTWALADPLTMLLGEARRLELAAGPMKSPDREAQFQKAKALLLTATAEEQNEPRLARMLKKIDAQAK